MLDLLGPPAAFALVATITPGGATALATASGSQFSLRRSVPMIAGIAAGMATLSAAAAIGLAGLLLAAPVLQLAPKIAGTAYLLWLARQIATAGPPRDTNVASPTAFLGGILLLWLNPKAWATTLGAAASFAGLASGPVELVAVLAATFAVAATLSLTMWCTGGVLLARSFAPTVNGGWSTRRSGSYSSPPSSPSGSAAEATRFRGSTRMGG